MVVPALHQTARAGRAAAPVPHACRPVACRRPPWAPVGALLTLLAHAVAQADGGPSTSARGPDGARLSADVWPARGADAAGGSQVWQRAVVWQRHGQAELGLGLAMRRSAEPPGTAWHGIQPMTAMAAQPGAVALVAVGRPLGTSMRVQIGAGIPVGSARPPGPATAWRDAAGGDADDLDRRGELRMGLSFHARSVAGPLRQGLSLRVELSGSTALILKPRAGRFGLQLNSRW